MQAAQALTAARGGPAGSGPGGPARRPSSRAAAGRRAGAAAAPGRVGLAVQASSSSSSAQGGPAAAPDLKSLEKALEAAAKREDYAEAARLRDELRTLRDSNPLVKLKAELAAAVAAENWAAAAALRDALKAAEPPPPPPPERLPTTSDTLTAGVRVRVRSMYVPDRSRPEAGSYFYAYRISLSNEGDQTVQLLSRMWRIVDASGHQETVKGPGVVGETPILAPGQTYDYTSACPLPTATGSMEGEYEFVVLAADGSKGAPFQVVVGRFGLDSGL